MLITRLQFISYYKSFYYYYYHYYYYYYYYYCVMYIVIRVLLYFVCYPLFVEKLLKVNGCNLRGIDF